MEELKFIYKNSIPFIKKINFLLLIHLSDSKNNVHISQLIHLFFHIYIIHIIYYKNVSLCIKLCEKCFILYTEIIASCENIKKTQEKHILPNINEINNYLYENTIDKNIIIKDNNLSDIVVTYININKIIYTYIFNDLLSHRNHFIKDSFKYLTHITLELNKNIFNYLKDNKEYHKNTDIIFIIIDNIFDLHNININTKIYIIISYITILKQKKQYNPDTIKEKVLYSLNNNIFNYLNNENTIIDLNKKEKDKLYTLISSIF